MSTETAKLDLVALPCLSTDSLCEPWRLTALCQRPFNPEPDRNYKRAPAQQVGTGTRPSRLSHVFGDRGSLPVMNTGGPTSVGFPFLRAQETGVQVLLQMARAMWLALTSERLAE